MDFKALSPDSRIWIFQSNRKLTDDEKDNIRIEANHFTPLSISLVHAQHAGPLPRHHDDPFDRMLIAQAQLEGLSIVTHDSAFEAYEVNLIPT